MARPVAMQPERIRSPSHHSRISAISAKGETLPVCPPAPAATAMMPSTPISEHLRACRSLMTSLKTRPTISVIALENRGPRRKREHHDGHPMFDDDRKISFKPFVGFMSDQID